MKLFKKLEAKSRKFKSVSRLGFTSIITLIILATAALPAATVISRIINTESSPISRIAQTSENNLDSNLYECTNNKTQIRAKTGEKKVVQSCGENEICNNNKNNENRLFCQPLTDYCNIEKDLRSCSSGESGTRCNWYAPNNQQGKCVPKNFATKLCSSQIAAHKIFCKDSELCYSPEKNTITCIQANSLPLNTICAKTEECIEGSYCNNNKCTQCIPGACTLTPAPEQLPDDAFPPYSDPNSNSTLSPPQDLTVNNYSNGKINPGLRVISWSPVNNANIYYVNINSIETTSVSNSSSYTFSAGSKYTISVIAGYNDPEENIKIRSNPSQTLSVEVNSSTTAPAPETDEGDSKRTPVPGTETDGINPGTDGSNPQSPAPEVKKPGVPGFCAKQDKSDPKEGYCTDHTYDKTGDTYCAKYGGDFFWYKCSSTTATLICKDHGGIKTPPVNGYSHPVCTNETPANNVTGNDGKFNAEKAKAGEYKNKNYYDIYECVDGSKEAIAGGTNLCNAYPWEAGVAKDTTCPENRPYKNASGTCVPRPDACPNVGPGGGQNVCQTTACTTAPDISSDISRAEANELCKDYLPGNPATSACCAKPAVGGTNPGTGSGAIRTPNATVTTCVTPSTPTDVRFTWTQPNSPAYEYTLKLTPGRSGKQTETINLTYTYNASLLSGLPAGNVNFEFFAKDVSSNQTSSTQTGSFTVPTTCSTAPTSAPTTPGQGTGSVGTACPSNLRVSDACGNSTDNVCNNGWTNNQSGISTQTYCCPTFQRFCEITNTCISNRANCAAAPTASAAPAAPGSTQGTKGQDEHCYNGNADCKEGYYCTSGAVGTATSYCTARQPGTTKSLCGEPGQFGTVAQSSTFICTQNDYPVCPDGYTFHPGGASGDAHVACRAARAGNWCCQKSSTSSVGTSSRIASLETQNLCMTNRECKEGSRGTACVFTNNPAIGVCK